MRLCQQYISDIGRVRSCMSHYRRYLSPACRAVFERGAKKKAKRSSSLRKNLEVERLLSFLRVGSAVRLAFDGDFGASDRSIIYVATNFGMRIRL